MPTETTTTTEVRTITNNRPDPVTIIISETSEMFSIPAKGVWSGTFNVPWVARQEEMSKCVTMSVGGKKFAYMFQDYNSPNAQICWAERPVYANNYEVQGENLEGGRKALSITTLPNQNGLWMEGLPITI